MWPAYEDWPPLFCCMEHRRMDFVTGLATGLALGLSLFIIKRFNLTSTTVKDSVNTAKKMALEGTEYKVVLVVRNDLKMGKGKIAAQCGHAAVGVYSKALKKHPDALKMWELCGQPKIALKVESESELDEIFTNAKNAGLVVSLIHDAGRTQIAAGSKTVLGIGPAPTYKIDELTGHLKLL